MSIRWDDRTGLFCGFRTKKVLINEWNGSSLSSHVRHIPDSMIFQPCEQIKNCMSQLPQGCWTESHNYGPTSGYYYIPCEHCKNFFKILSSTNFDQEYFFFQSNYYSLLSKLLRKSYINKKEKTLLSKVNNGLSERDINDNILLSKNNLHECLKRLNYYCSKLQGSEIDPMLISKIVPFILGVRSRTSLSISFVDQIMNFLNNFCTCLSDSDGSFRLLEDKELMKMIIKINKVKKISYFNPGYILENETWENLCCLITISTSLEVLELNSTWPSDFEERMPEKYLPMLGNSIARSRSLVTVSMTENQFSTKEIKEFLRMISGNKNIKLVNLFGSIVREDVDKFGDIFATFRVHY